MNAEDLFVERVKALAPGSDRLRVGIGDDAAVIETPAGPLVATTDMLVEEVDFLAGEEPERLGRRAAAVNLSDLAAMGARPEFFLLCVGFPRELGPDYPLAVARGAVSRAAVFEAVLAGGDISEARQTVVAIAFWGRPESEPLLRSGARPGDHVWVSGWPGRAAAGLKLAQLTATFTSVGSPPTPHLIGLEPGKEAELLDAYRDPEPRVALGQALARGGLAHAAIDVSDGLGLDASRLARASGVRIVLERERLPLAPALAAWADVESLDPLELVLGGGDDYELLFAAPPDAEGRLAAGSPEWGVPVRRIGTCEEGSGTVLRFESGERDIARLGFDHLERRP
ncbi:MAG: thiamine-phosphate kinase [Thermoanaerobaculia bacterium]